MNCCFATQATPQLFLMNACVILLCTPVYSRSSHWHAPECAGMRLLLGKPTVRCQASVPDPRSFCVVRRTSRLRMMWTLHCVPPFFLTSCNSKSCIAKTVGGPESRENLGEDSGSNTEYSQIQVDSTRYLGWGSTSSAPSQLKSGVTPKSLSGFDFLMKHFSDWVSLGSVNKEWLLMLAPGGVGKTSVVRL